MPPNISSQSTPTHNPLLVLATGFSVGIVAAKFLITDWTVLTALLVVSSFVALIQRANALSAPALFLAFAAAGGLCFFAETNSIADDRLRQFYDTGRLISGDALDLEGVVISGTEPAHDGYFIELASEEITSRGTTAKATGNVRLFIPIDGPEAGNDFHDLQISYGSRLLIACRPVREEQFQNPGVRSRKESLDEQGIDVVTTLKSPLLIENIGQERMLVPLGFIFEWRERLIDSFRKNLDGRAAGVMIASLLGDKYFVDKATADAFREGGIFHILIISGLHITFLGGLALFFVTRFTRQRLVQFVVTAGFLWAYTLAVGANIPVLRASLVFTLLLFSRLIYRTPNLLNTLGACALLLLVHRPSSIFTSSFQLTFVSVGAIVGIAFPVIEKLRSIGRWMPSAEHPFPPSVPLSLRRFAETLYWRDALWEHEGRRHIWSGNLFKSPLFRMDGHGTLQTGLAYLFEAFVISVIIQICLLPLSVYHFHRISFVGIVLNLWVGLLLAVETFVAVFAVFISLLSETLALPIFRAADLLNSVLLYFPELFSGSGWAGIRLPAYSGFGLLIYFAYFVPGVMLAIALYRWDPFKLLRRWSVRDAVPVLGASALLAIFATIIVMHPLSLSPADGTLRVDLLDVGQGDAALVTFPNGETLLVDGGGRIDFHRPVTDRDGEDRFERDIPGIGEEVVSRYLWHKGYSAIDYVLATHADADHIDGLGDIAQNFAVGKVFIGRAPDGDMEYAAFTQILNERNISRQSVRKGDSFIVAGVVVDVLWPDPELTSFVLSDNDNSVVVKLTFGSRSILLTGDIERSAEPAIVTGGSSLKADVVKVPHHGSRTSSTSALVDAARAEYAIISVGRRSRFGHPHLEVVQRWQASGAKVMTTGERGMISVSTDGENIELNTFLPQ